MAHDIFISYSTRDKPVADAVCAKLEAEGLRCWVAPRDIIPGMDWGSSIIEAIEGARLMVLVMSASADASPQILREVERAVNKGLRIVPLRIEDIKLGKSLEYFLGTPHWLDAITPPLEEHLQYLAHTAKVLLDPENAPAQAPAPHVQPPARMAPLVRIFDAHRNAFLSGLAAAIIVLAVIVWRTLHPDTVPPRLAGNWATTGYAGPDKVRFSLEIGKNGVYRYGVTYEESGKVEVENGEVFFITADRNERPAGPVIPKISPPVSANLIEAAPAAVWPLIGRFSHVTPELPQSNPFRLVQPGQPAGSGTASSAVWEWTPAFGQMVWQIRFEFDQSGTYLFTAQATDLGTINAHEGTWIASSSLTNTQSRGGYSLVANNTLVMTGTIRGALSTTSNGQTLWERSAAVAAASATTAAPVPAAALSPPPTPVASASAAVAAVSPTPAAQPGISAIDRKFLIAHSSPVYAGPDSATAVIAHVRRGRHVHVTGLTGDWLRVQTSQGIVGFIPDRAVE
jgi:hypothetical protein